MGHVLKIGSKVGMLTVVSDPYLIPEQSKNRWYLDLKCTCGRSVKRRVSAVRESIKKNSISSCGCWRLDPSRSVRRRIRNIYSQMLQRCGNPNNSNWKNYGGRGISVCDDWKASFHSFHAWAMSNGYQPDLTIERVDVNGNYCPENCCWIPMRDQAKNTRQVRRLTFGETTDILKSWSDRLGVHESSIRGRLDKGIPVEKALDTSGLVLVGTKGDNGKRPRCPRRLSGFGTWKTRAAWAKELGYKRQHISYLLAKHGSIDNIPPRKTRQFKQNRLITYNGITDTFKGWGKRLGIRPLLIRERLEYGWPLEKVFSRPPRNRSTPGSEIN